MHYSIGKINLLTSRNIICFNHLLPSRQFCRIFLRYCSYTLYIKRYWKSVCMSKSKVKKMIKLIYFGIIRKIMYNELLGSFDNYSWAFWKSCNRDSDTVWNRCGNFKRIGISIWNFYKPYWLLLYCYILIRYILYWHFSVSSL